MPIDTDEFAKGRKISGLERSVLQFLKKNSDSAYTESEIMAAIYPGRVSNWTGVAKRVVEGLVIGNALDNLTKDGSIRAREVNGVIYYKAD